MSNFESKFDTFQSTLNSLQSNINILLNQNKQIFILYKEEESAYQIKSEYWFAIANAIKRSNDLIIQKYKAYSELIPMIQQTLEEII